MNAIPKMLIAASAVALMNAPRAWSAPDAAPQAQAQARDEAKYEAIQIKNVPPSWMAHLLDPASYPTQAAQAPAPPVSYTRAELEKVLRKGTSQAEIDAILNKGELPAARRRQDGVFELPKGVESITPDDATGALQARGTAEGIARLRTVISFLDLPLRRVEVEVHTVRINSTDLATVAQGASYASAQGAVRLGFLREKRDFGPLLQEMLDSNRATDLLNVRATIINNLSSSFGSGGRDAVGNSIASGYEMQVTPTINNDNTITVVISATTGTPGGVAGGTKIQTVANVDDGDTIVLAGLTQKETEQATVTFLTARIIRRADEQAEKK